MVSDFIYIQSMAWFIDVSLHKQLPPVCAVSTSHYISFCVMWEVKTEPHGCWVKGLSARLVSEHGPCVSGEPREQILWGLASKHWNLKRVLILPGMSTSLWGGCLGKCGRALPSCCKTLPFTIASASTPAQLVCRKNTSLGRFHGNRQRDCNAKRKV